LRSKCGRSFSSPFSFPPAPPEFSSRLLPFLETGVSPPLPGRRTDDFLRITAENEKNIRPSPSFFSPSLHPPITMRTLPFSLSLFPFYSGAIFILRWSSGESFSPFSLFFFSFRMGLEYPLPPPPGSLLPVASRESIMKVSRRSCKIKLGSHVPSSLRIPV